MTYLLTFQKLKNHAAFLPRSHLSKSNGKYHFLCFCLVHSSSDAGSASKERYNIFFGKNSIFFENYKKLFGDALDHFLGKGAFLDKKLI